MKKILIALVLLVPAVAHAWPRLGSQSTPHFTDNGNRSTFMAVAINDATPTLIYSGADRDREILIQNESSYKIYIGSSTAVRAASGPRAIIRAGTDYWTNNTGPIYGIAESGGSATLLGSVEYDRKDP